MSNIPYVNLRNAGLLIMIIVGSCYFGTQCLVGGLIGIVVKIIKIEFFTNKAEI